MWRSRRRSWTRSSSDGAFLDKNSVKNLRMMFIRRFSYKFFRRQFSGSESGDSTERFFGRKGLALVERTRQSFAKKRLSK